LSGKRLFHPSFCRQKNQSTTAGLNQNAFTFYAHVTNLG
jgi:hypothetical protein